MPLSHRDERMRLTAGLVSLAVGSMLLVVKYFAYRITGSSAILSDALESIVNVIAALFAVGGILFAGRPADRNHPYGLGNIEFFSAVFEGGLIAFAAVLIIYQAALTALEGVTIRALDRGLLITLAAGLCNATLGWYLIRTGRRYQSITLVADGKHVMSDFWTSAGVAVGLGLVMITGWPIFDPIVAAFVGINLAWTGFQLVRHAAGGLLDEEDTELMGKLVRALNANVTPGIIRVHYLRAIRSGRFTHVDAHLVVPEFWTVERAHETADSFERRVIESLPFEGEIAFHTDPCRQAYCTTCDVADCPIRVAPFVGRMPMTVAEAVQPDVLASA
jgi:cation diffusion facilitator family transporter